MDEMRQIWEQSWPDSQAEIDAEEYAFFERHFKAESAMALVHGVTAAHHYIALDFNYELLCACEAFYRVRDHNDKDALLVSYMRSYRSVDWYLTKLTRSIVLELVEPYSRFVDNPKPDVFLGRTAVEVIQRKVLSEAFPGVDLYETIRQYKGNQRNLRNQVVHGLTLPTVDESRHAILGAIEVFEVADCRRRDKVNPVPPG